MPGSLIGFESLLMSYFHVCPLPHCLVPLYRVASKTPLAQFEDEKHEHEMKMKKMENEMEQVFEMKVKEKKKKLEDSEKEVGYQTRLTRTYQDVQRPRSLRRHFGRSVCCQYCISSAECIAPSGESVRSI